MPSIAPAPYEPETISHPGETILDMLDDLHMSQVEFARRMGRPINKVNEIINGKRGITVETALELEQVLGLPASFWLNREQNYRLALSRQSRAMSQSADSEIVQRFPYVEMAKLGWVASTRKLPERRHELLNFFRVASLTQLEKIQELAPSFRKSQLKKASPEALAAWLRRGMIATTDLSIGTFDKQAVRDQLLALRELTLTTRERPQQTLQERCGKLGIAVVFVPHLEKTYVGGAAYWLNGPSKLPVIQLSDLGRTNDRFWFNFFHELGHILLHSPKETWLDDFTNDQSPHEVEANQFAADTLIPPIAYEQLLSRNDLSVAGVEEFSKTIGIAPAIVVGRLQREKRLRNDWLNGLKFNIEII